MCCTEVCRKTCLGHSCIHDGGCAGARCCGSRRKRKCLETCIGEPCEDESDCSFGSKCCGGVDKCQHKCGDDYPLVSLVAAYAAGILILLCLCACCCHKIRRAAYSRCGFLRRRDRQEDGVELETVRQRDETEMQPSRVNQPLLPPQDQPSHLEMSPPTDLDQPQPPPYLDVSPPTDLDQPQPPPYLDVSPPTDLDQPQPPPYLDVSIPTDFDQPPPPPYPEVSSITDFDQPPPPYSGEPSPQDLDNFETTPNEETPPFCTDDAPPPYQP